MDKTTTLHKLTAFSQLLEELQSRAEDMQFELIKSAGEDDLCLMLISRYPLRLKSIEKGATTADLLQNLGELLPIIKKINER